MPKKSTGRPRGRPAHVPTALSRRKVAIAAGGGMRHQDIAIALGINRDTLTKHYERELSVVAIEKRMEALQGLHAAAKKGSAAAVKAYLAMQPELAAPPAGVGDGWSTQPAAPTPPAPEPQQKLAAPLGKKDQQKADAATAHVGTEWETILKPSASLQ